MSYLRDWNGYNEALVKLGLILLDLDFVAGWSRELKAMNNGKEGVYGLAVSSLSCFLVNHNPGVASSLFFTAPFFKRSTVG
jgi:hypothetical protein